MNPQQEFADVANSYNENVENARNVVSSYDTSKAEEWLEEQGLDLSKIKDLSDALGEGGLSILGLKTLNEKIRSTLKGEGNLQDQLGSATDDIISQAKGAMSSATDNASQIADLKLQSAVPTADKPNPFFDYQKSVPFPEVEEGTFEPKTGNLFSAQQSIMDADPEADVSGLTGTLSSDIQIPTAAADIVPLSTTIDHSASATSALSAGASDATKTLTQVGNDAIANVTKGISAVEQGSALADTGTSIATSALEAAADVGSFALDALGPVGALAGAGLLIAELVEGKASSTPPVSKILETPSLKGLSVSAGMDASLQPPPSAIF